MGAHVELGPPDVAVEPGSSAVTTLRVVNTGSVVDHFTFDILGAARAWTTAEPALMPLFPGAEGIVHLTFRPPRTPRVAAGPMPYAVRVTSRQDQDGSVVEEGNLEIAPFFDVSAKLTPRTSEAKRCGRPNVVVENRGNSLVDVEVSAEDPDDRLEIRSAPRHLGIDPGATATSRLAVRARRLTLTGAERNRPFKVHVDFEDGPPVSFDGLLLQRPILPGWALAVVVLAAVLLVAGAVAGRLTGFSPRSLVPVLPGATGKQARAGEGAGGDPALAEGAAITVDSSRDLGLQLVGTTSAEQVIKLRSTGRVPLEIGKVELKGANAGPFHLAGNSCSGKKLAPGQDCGISVTFSPEAAGSRSATLAVPSNAPGSPHTVALGGQGFIPTARLECAVEPPQLDFADQEVNTAAEGKSATVTGKGRERCRIDRVTLGGNDPGDFRLVTDGCSGKSLATGVKCSVGVSFLPTGVGSRSGTLVVASNAPGSTALSLSGAGFARPTPGSVACSIRPSEIDFGRQQKETFSRGSTVTVTSVGSSPCQVGKVTLAGANAGDFRIAGETCGQPLAENQECSVTVTFAPKGDGPRNASLAITSNAPDSPSGVALRGDSYTPEPLAQCGVDPGELDFGDQQENTTGYGRRVTVTSTGSTPCQVTGVTLQGPNRGEFAVTGNNCGSTLATGDQCVITVTFNPNGTGVRSASLAIASNAGAASVTLQGNGVPPPPADLAVDISGPSGMTSDDMATYRVVVTNQGPGAAGGVQVTTALPSELRFFGATASQGTCSSAAVGQSDTVTCLLGSLASLAEVTIEIEVEAGYVSSSSRTVKTTAEVHSGTSDQNTGNNTDSQSTTIYPDICTRYPWKCPEG